MYLSGAARRRASFLVSALRPPGLAGRQGKMMMPFATPTRLAQLLVGAALLAAFVFGLLAGTRTTSATITSPDTTGFVGEYTSVALDASGFPVVSYWDNNNANLKVLHCNDVNCTGGGESIESPDTGGNVGSYTSLALDADGFPVVSYFDSSNNDLKVLHCNDVNCTGGDESITSPDTGGIVGLYTSLVLDGAGFPVVSYYDNTNDDYDLGGAGPTKLHDIPGAAATDAIRFVLIGTEYAAFAGQTAWTYSSDHTDPVNTWTDRTEDVDFFTFWDGKLWLIDDNGDLRWTLDPAAAPIQAANLQDDFAIQDGDVTSMFVGPDAIGEPIIYVGTKIGLFAHDFANGRFLKTSVIAPRAADNGKGARAWNGDIYFPAEQALLRYNPGRQLIANVGLDAAGGDPDLTDAKIYYLASTPVVLYAVVKAAGFSTRIMAYNGRGWAWPILNEPSADTVLLVSDAYGKKRLWFGRKVFGSEIGYADISYNILDHSNDSTIEYGGRGDVVTPWFDAFQGDVAKLALRLKVEVDDATTNEKITVRYRLNNSTGAFVTSPWGDITASGVTNLNFPDNATPKGTTFRSIQFLFQMARGSTVTLSPKIRSITFEYRKKLTPKYGFEFDIDLTEPYGGRDPRKMFNDLITAVESNILVEFNYESETGGTRNAFVDVASFTGQESTGLQPEGIFSVVVVEP